MRLLFSDCSIEMGENQDEPMVGLQHLLIGGARMARKEYQPAINAYRRCIAKRANITTQDMHISAFAHFELATLLLHCNRNVAPFDHSQALNRNKHTFIFIFRMLKRWKKRRNSYRMLRNFRTTTWKTVFVSKSNKN